MEAVIIGVSDRSSLWRHGKLKESEYKTLVNDYAVFLAKHFDNLIIVPDDGVYTDIAREFSKIKKKKAIAYYPDKDTQYGIKHLNAKDFDLRPINGDWYKLNAELTKQSNIIICLGFTPGVMIEAAFIKYHQKYSKLNIKLFIDERCIEHRLPSSFHEQIKNIFYYSSLEELSKLLE